MKNYLKRFVKDPEAVSPVVGVILMVAITVILAAIIAAFVLGLGGPTASAPKASLKVLSANSSTLCIEHQGGDTVAPQALELSIGGTRYTTGGGGNQWTDGLVLGERALLGVSTSATPITGGGTVLLVHNTTNQQMAQFIAPGLASGALTC